MLSLTEALTQEWRGSGVQVMVVHPGATDTAFFDGTSASSHPAATDNPERVAAGIIDDLLRGRSTSFPGQFRHRTMNWSMSWVHRFLPRATVARATGRMNRSLGLHEAHDLG